MLPRNLQRFSRLLLCSVHVSKGTQEVIPPRISEIQTLMEHYRKARSFKSNIYPRENLLSGMSKLIDSASKSTPLEDLTANQMISLLELYDGKHFRHESYIDSVLYLVITSFYPEYSIEGPGGSFTFGTTLANPELQASESKRYADFNCNLVFPNPKRQFTLEDLCRLRGILVHAGFGKKLTRSQVSTRADPVIGGKCGRELRSDDIDKVTQASKVTSQQKRGSQKHDASLSSVGFRLTEAQQTTYFQVLGGIINAFCSNPKAVEKAPLDPLLSCLVGMKFSHNADMFTALVSALTRLAAAGSHTDNAGGNSPSPSSKTSVQLPVKPNVQLPVKPNVLLKFCGAYSHFLLSKGRKIVRNKTSSRKEAVHLYRTKSLPGVPMKTLKGLLESIARLTAEKLSTERSKSDIIAINLSLALLGFHELEYFRIWKQFYQDAISTATIGDIQSITRTLALVNGLNGDPGLLQREHWGDNFIFRLTTRVHQLRSGKEELTPSAVEGL